MKYILDDRIVSALAKVCILRLSVYWTTLITRLVQNIQYLP